MAIMRVRTQLTGSQGLPGLSTVYANGTTVTPSGADASDMVARVRAFWAAIAALLPASSIVLVSGQVDVIDPSNGALTSALSVAAPASVLGTGGASLPLAAAMLLTAETGLILNGRRFRGRTFVSPVSTAVNVGGLTTSGSRTTMTTAANNMLIGATSSVPVVWHRPKLPGPLGGSASPVITYSVGSNFAILKSRRD